MEKLARARNLLYVAPFVVSGAMAQTTPTATELEAFDVNAISGKALGILGVGVTVTLGFVLYKVGKRASNKI